MSEATPVPDRLAGVHEKIRRARRHSGELRRKIERWGETQRYEFVHDHDLESGKHTLRVKPPELPLEWSVIVGDLLFNLRSALDHLIYGLVIESNLSTGITPAMPPKKNRLQFPIFSASKDYPPRVPTYLGTLRSDWEQHIEALQPYHRTQRPTELEILAALNDFDKHRALHCAALIVATMDPETVAAWTPLDDIKSIRLSIHNYIGLPIEKAELHGIIVDPPTAQLEFHPQQVPPVQVAFDGGDAFVPTGQLVDVIREVRRIVRIFAPAFEGGTI